MHLYKLAMPCHVRSSSTANWHDTMRFSAVITGLTGLVASVNAANILLNNDDGFGSGNLREVYRLLKKEGHDGKTLPGKHEWS